MRQFHKGQRLIALCDKKTRREQQVLSRCMRQKQELLDAIAQCDEELVTLDKVILSQQIHGVATTKVNIFIQRRQQVILLHQRQQLRLERAMRVDNLEDIEQEILQSQRQLAFLKRREIKFTKWTHSSKKEWLLQIETANEHELQESVPWRCQ